ncbi:MAG TPA: hypothetical protein VFR17_00020 [Mycobacterium sp.]|nr:hypothetical protein [Mycobacterium sp.]
MTITEYRQKSDSAKLKVEGLNWKPVPGTGGRIAASSAGWVASPDHKLTVGYNYAVGFYTVLPEARKVAVPVHLLTAAAWLPHPELSWPDLAKLGLYRLVRHIDGNNTNNRVDNLAWAGPVEDFAFFEWLSRQPPEYLRQREVAPASSPKWRGE